jgi:hypothetical protein
MLGNKHSGSSREVLVGRVRNDKGASVGTFTHRAVSKYETGRIHRKKKNGLN